jgi:hypothetical protein
MTKMQYKPGVVVPKCGKASIIDAKGKPAGKECPVTEGKIFPPSRAKRRTYDLDAIPTGQAPTLAEISEIVHESRRQRRDS